MFGIKLLLVLALVPLAGCADPEFSPIRPQGVPADAQFVGGVDGGEWHSCVANTPQSVTCTTFHPQSAEPVTKHEYLLCLKVATSTVAPERSVVVTTLDEGGALFNSVPGYLVSMPEVLRLSSETDEAFQDRVDAESKYYLAHGVDRSCQPLPGATTPVVKPR